MLLQTTMGDTYYSANGRRDRRDVLTPYSAVSSFNLPLQYDQSLVTPVAMTPSLPASVRPSFLAPKDMDIKLSPSSVSPCYELFQVEEDYPQDRYSEPMKLKDPSTALRISTSDHYSPCRSPTIPTSPFYHHGLSGTPAAARSDSSLNMNQSPSLQNTHPACGIISVTSHSRHPTPVLASNYRSPIRIAPNPPSLRPALQALQPDSNPYRRSSITSLPPITAVPLLTTSTTTLMSFHQQQLKFLPVRRKRKASTKDFAEGEIVISTDMTAEEKVLYQLAIVEELPWKEIAVKYREQTGKLMKVPALQMKRKRLEERLRVWTPSDDQALRLAFEGQQSMRWEQVAQEMLKFGCPKKWPKETVEKQWYELQRRGERHSSEYEVSSAKHSSMNGDYNITDDLSSSKRRKSTTQSLHESENTSSLSAVSPSNMSGMRSRQGSDASSDYQYQHHSPHPMFDHQQQNWQG